MGREGQLPGPVATAHQRKVGLVCVLELSTLMRSQSSKRTLGSSAPPPFCWWQRRG